MPSNYVWQLNLCGSPRLRHRQEVFPHFPRRKLSERNKGARMESACHMSGEARHRGRQSYVFNFLADGDFARSTFPRKIKGLVNLVYIFHVLNGKSLFVTEVRLHRVNTHIHVADLSVVRRTRSHTNLCYFATFRHLSCQNFAHRTKFEC